MVFLGKSRAQYLHPNNIPRFEFCTDSPGLIILVDQKQ